VRTREDTVDRASSSRTDVHVRIIRADQEGMVLLLGMGFSLWLGVSAVVVTICMAAARGDRALAASIEEVAEPIATAPSLTTPVVQQRSVAS
jgi:hypothetical protein